MTTARRSDVGGVPADKEGGGTAERTVRVLLVPAEAECASEVREALAPSVRLQIEPNEDAALVAVRKQAPDVAIVDLGADPTVGVSTLRELHQAAPQLHLVALGRDKDPERIVEVMRAGARDFAVLDDPAELGRIVSSASRGDAAPSAARDAGTIVVTFGAKGGVGATTLVTNVAAAAAAAGKRVLIVDLDVRLGDALVVLDLAPRFSIVDVLRNQQRLDRDLLFSSLPRHRSGVWVLSQGDDVDGADAIDPAQVPGLLHFLARHFDLVIVDGVRGFDDLALAALDVADRVLLVFTQDVPALRNSQRALDVLGRLGYDRDKVRLVVNRHDGRRKMDLQIIADALGLAVDAVVPSDEEAVTRAADRGQLLVEAAPRARVARGMAELAALLGASPPKPPEGFMSRLFHRHRHGEGTAPTEGTSTTDGGSDDAHRSTAAH